MKIPQTDGREVRFVTMNYHAQKLPIFPCKALEPWDESFLIRASNGFTGRYKWAAEFRTANIGLATGLKWFVLEASYPEGIISLAKLEKDFSQLPETAEIHTGDGARLLFFNMPSNASISNSTSLIAKGLSVYAKGRFVLLPPSTQVDRMPNKWRDATQVANAPVWLIKLIVSSSPYSAGLYDEGQ